ncbi:MAG: class I SAM-dependent methyltransferase [Microbacteriaceae bacterium]
MLTDTDFAELRRWPDVEADNLFASDASDRLILDEAAPFIVGSAEGVLAVIGDNYGALTLGAIAAGARNVRVHQDALTGERALDANAAALTFAGEFSHHALDQKLLTGALLVLLQLPRSLDELDEIAEAIAQFADPNVVVVAGGRIKHLTPTMNPVLLKHFERLDVSHARQKSRVLIARGVKSRVAPDGSARHSRFPLSETHSDVRLTVKAHGSAFAGTGVDIGTRALLGVLRKAQPDAETVIDLGCGTGILAAAVALARPGVHVIATDHSAGAVASALATMEANGVSDRVTVVRDDGLIEQPTDSADLILLNPPFHVGATVHTGLAHRMFADAARVLRPGGELWTVFNTHLGYRQALARIVGPTELVTHNAKFTVTASTKPAPSPSSHQSKELAD